MVLGLWIVCMKGDFRDGLVQIPHFKGDEIQKPPEGK